MVGVCRINKGYQPIDGAVRRTSALLRRHAYRVTPLLTCGIQAPLLWICFWVCINKKRAKRRVSINILAERGGFEPPIGYEPIHAFQACDLNHSSTSPEFVPDACDRTKPAIIAKLGHCRLSTNRDKKKPLHLSVKRQSGNRAIGVSPTTFPHKLALLLKLNHRQPMAACRGVLLYLPCFSWPASADPGWPGFPASTHLA